MKYYQKIVLLVLLIVVILGGVVMNIKYQKNFELAQKPNGSENNTEENAGTPLSMCYYKGTKTDRNFYDVAWLKFNINGNQITGEFQNLPAEKDSKIGKFEGTVGPLIPEKMSREADVIWDTYAEGMNNKEELKFDFGDGSAFVYFGEMTNRGDGVYIYKNKSIQPEYGVQMNQIDCENLEEKIYMEKYVRDHITDIAKQQAVLGGTWYVLSVFIDPSADKGEVVYEDGHMQAAADFSYTYSKNNNTVNFSEFEEKSIQ